MTAQGIGSSTATGGPSLATAAFDHVSLHGTRPSGAWAGDVVGGSSGGLPASAEVFRQAGGRFTVTGSGDIAPDVPAVPADRGTAIEFTLVGGFAGLIAVVVVGTMFMTAEYRRGLIRTTLAASPRRGRVLAAKAIVIGAVTFAAGLAGAVVAVPLGERLLRDHGFYILPVTTLTELRVVVGTAALLGVAAVLALAIGTLLRRSAVAVTAFAIQQSTPQYPQVSGRYTPSNGYFPLPPWAGFAVLCAYAALALGLAAVLLRRRDA